MDSVKASAHSTSVLTKLSRGVVNFVKKPKLLFWLFIALNLVPNFCLLFTEPLSGLGKLILVLVPLSIYMIVFSLFKRAGIMQLILIHAFQLVLFYLFGESVIAVDMFLNLPTTNASEAGELLGNIWPSIIIVCVLYIPVIALASIAVHHKVRRTAVFRKHMITWGIILFIIGSGLVAFEKHRDNSYEVKTDIYPANVMYNLCLREMEPQHELSDYLQRLHIRSFQRLCSPTSGDIRAGHRRGRKSRKLEPMGISSGNQSVVKNRR